MLLRCKRFRTFSGFGKYEMKIELRKREFKIHRAKNQNEWGTNIHSAKCEMNFRSDSSNSKADPHAEER